MKGSFEDLGIKEQKLEPGDVELGVLIPRRHIKNRLDKFSEEIAHFDEALKLFSVVATGTREDFQITYISASDLKFFLRPNARTAALVGATATLILTSLNQIADLKLKIEQIREMGIEEEALQPLRKAADLQLTTDLEGQLGELVMEYGIDKREHDENEDLVRLRHAIRFVAPRLERGFAIEIRVGPIPEPEEDDDREEGEGEEEILVDRELIDKLQDQAQRLKFIEPIGDSILELERPDWSDVAVSDDASE